MKTSVLLGWRIVAASLPLIGAYLLLAAAPATGPLRLHPDNPRWFQWRGHATLNLRRGRWKAEWIAVEDGKLLKRETISASGKPVDLVSPNFSDAVALRLVRL